MSDKPKLKITVLKRLDPHEMFGTLPVTLKKPMGPCSVFHDGQVIHVDESLRMPDGFCELPGRTFTTTSGPWDMAVISLSSRRPTSR